MRFLLDTTILIDASHLRVLDLTETFVNKSAHLVEPEPMETRSMLVDVKTKDRRVHVVMPDDLIAEVDALVGKRRRSQFIVETVAAELQRRRLRAALAEMDGALAEFDIPGWETPESAAAWVRALRDGEDVPRSSDSAA